MMNKLIVLFISLWANTVAFTAVPSTTTRCTHNLVSSLSSSTNDEEQFSSSSRRSVLVQTATTVSSLLVAGASNPANAGIDVSTLKALPVEGDTTGARSRLQQIESANGPQPDDEKDIAFEKLPSGSSYRQYREGKGDAEVKNGSKVAIECTIRCQSFATANEPGGLKYFSTKTDTEFNELAWTIGDGTFPPELEDAMMGMKRQGVRRIELPSTVIFAAKKKEQLPLPQTKDGKRLFERLFKTDATMLFEVLVTRIK